MRKIRDAKRLCQWRQLMLRQYVIATRLVSIIQTIQLSRETGILIAKRGEGSSAEEGRIVFTSGRITEAKTSRPNVSDAFNHISTWENCLVSFVPQDPAKDISHLLGSSSTGASVLSEGQKLIPFTPLPKGARPVHGRPQDQSRNTPVLNSSLPLGFTRQELVTPIPFLIQPLPVALQQIEQMGLSRAHRQLVLLIDGKRSLEELAHGMGRTISNVQELLHDLTRFKLL
jgi:hypothetical protein